MNSHQLLAELPEQLRLLRVGAEELAIQAGEGWAPGAAAGGSGAGGGALGRAVQLLPLAGGFRALRRGRGVQEGGLGALAESCNGPPQREVRLLRGAWRLPVFVSLNRRGSTAY